MNSKHVNITLEDDLYKQLKIWAAKNDMTLLAAGTALLSALAKGDPRAKELVAEWQAKQKK